MKRQDELEVPVKKLKKLAFTLHDLVERGDEGVVSTLLLSNLFVDVLSEVSDGRDVVIHLVKL